MTWTVEVDDMDGTSVIEDMVKTMTTKSLGSNAVPVPILVFEERWSDQNQCQYWSSKNDGAWYRRIRCPCLRIIKKIRESELKDF